MPGNGDAPSNYPGNTYQCRQDSTFRYICGLEMPDMVGVMDVDDGQDYLFADDVTMDDIIWMGPQPSVNELGAKAGIANTKPLADLQEMTTLAVREVSRVHFLPPDRADKKNLIG